MHPADIKAELEKAQSSQTQIARKLQVSKVTVSHVIHGRSTSYPVASAIAQATKLTLDDLWPGRYNYTPRQRAA